MTSVWTTGVTIIADALQVCSLAFVKLEHLENLNDFIYLEYIWQDVQSAVETSVIALRGTLNMMSSSTSSQKEGDMPGRRNSSISSASSFFRKLSTAFSNGVGSSTPSSRRSSYSVPNYDSLSAQCPTSIHKRGAAIAPHSLETIPPTPAPLQDQHCREINPFEIGFERYF
jgi:hypothetical protein